MCHNVAMAKLIQRFLRTISVVILGLIILIPLLVLSYHWRHHGEPYSYGVTFSVKYANELGLDPVQAYTAILDELRPQRVRLMSYWDLVEPQPGHYDFGWLDQEISQAHNRGAAVSLAIGLRQPRYPECFEPSWADQMSRSDRDAHLNTFIKAVVDRYRSNSAITAWELENEALLGSFGACTDFDRGRLANELTLVQHEDPQHPIVTNMSDEWGYPVLIPKGGQIGFSVYYRCYVSFLHTYLQNPWPAWWHTLRAAVIELIWHKRVIIHELQTEPWGPAPTESLSNTQQDQSMSLGLMWHNYNLARSTGIRQQDLWGAEWWYWRKVHGDSRFWDAAKQMLADNSG